MEGVGTFLRRSVPSAGGLFPLELFVFLQRVEGLSDGLYHYDVRGHSLEPLRGDPIADLAPFLYPYPFVRDANLVFAVAAVFGRNQKKYGPRGYRYTLLEAGHVAQNICLRAVELGLGTLCMGGFEDSRLNRMLGLEPSKEGAVYAVAAGYDCARKPRVSRAAEAGRSSCTGPLTPALSRREREFSAEAGCHGRLSAEE